MKTGSVGPVESTQLLTEPVLSHHFCQYFTGLFLAVIAGNRVVDGLRYLLQRKGDISKFIFPGIESPIS